MVITKKNEETKFVVAPVHKHHFWCFGDEDMNLELNC